MHLRKYWLCLFDIVVRIDWSQSRMSSNVYVAEDAPICLCRQSPGAKNVFILLTSINHLIRSVVQCHTMFPKFMWGKCEKCQHEPRYPETIFRKRLAGLTTCQSVDTRVKLILCCRSCMVVKVMMYVYIYHSKGQFCIILVVTDINISRLRLGWCVSQW